MKETFCIQGLVLRRVPYRERDSLVSVYSPDRGRVDLLARGTQHLKSKLAGHLEPISLSQLMIINGKRYDYVCSALNEDAYLRIKDDLERTTYAAKALKEMNRVLKAGEVIGAREVFVCLRDYLDVLNSLSKNIDLELFYHFFLLKISRELGCGIELKNCVECGKKIGDKNTNFSPQKGGVACSGCSDINDLTFDEDCIKLLQLVLDKDFSYLSNIKTNVSKKINKIISSFYLYHFG